MASYEDRITNTALPIRSPLGDQGLLRRLFDHFRSPFGLLFWKKSTFLIQIIDYHFNDGYVAQIQA